MLRDMEVHIVEAQLSDSDSSTGNKWQQQKHLDLLMRSMRIWISCLVF
jgi:hypothetical protein